MMIKDLVQLLLAHDPNARVLLMTTRKQPAENQLVGVVARSEMADQEGRDEPGVAEDDVFLTVGPRMRPGSLSAWLVPERASRSGASTAPSRNRDEALRVIAEDYLDIEDLCAPGADSEPAVSSVDDVRRALEAAYDQGIASVLQRARTAASLDEPSGAAANEASLHVE